MKVKFDIFTGKTTITFKPDFRRKENKNKTALKLIYSLNKSMGKMVL